MCVHLKRQHYLVWPLITFAREVQFLNLQFSWFKIANQKRCLPIESSSWWPNLFVRLEVATICDSKHYIRAYLSSIHINISPKYTFVINLCQSIEFTSLILKPMSNYLFFKFKWCQLIYYFDTWTMEIYVILAYLLELVQWTEWVILQNNPSFYFNLFFTCAKATMMSNVPLPEVILVSQDVCSKDGTKLRKLQHILGLKLEFKQLFSTPREW